MKNQQIIGSPHFGGDFLYFYRKLIDMENKDARIQFAVLFKRIYKTEIVESNDIQEVPFYEVDKVVEFIIKLAKKKRFYNLKSDKFCFIDDAEIDGNYISGTFKSARNKFRPNIINKTTGDERPNPKSKLDGEIEKTHFVIKIDKDDNSVYLFLESNFNGISLLNLTNYFNIYSKFYNRKIKESDQYSLKHDLVGINNFKTELERFSRTKVAEVYYDKKILGSDYLNFNKNRVVPVKEDVMLTMKADKGLDINSIALEAYNKLTGNSKSGITRVRIRGNDENGNETTIDTEHLARKEFISSLMDEDKGEFITEEFLKQLLKIARAF